MFDCGRDDMLSRRVQLQGGIDGGVVGFRAAAGENEFARLALEQAARRCRARSNALRTCAPNPYPLEGFPKYLVKTAAFPQSRQDRAAWSRCYRNR